MTEEQQAFLEKVSGAAAQLPKAEPGVIEERGGYRFIGQRWQSATEGWFTEWELLGRCGFSTGITFGHWPE